MNKTTATVTTCRALLTCLTLGVIISVLACLPATAQKKARDEGSPQRNTKQPKKTVAYYSCPMDGEVKAKSPGKCPKCGMLLRAVYEATPATAAVAARMMAWGAKFKASAGWTFVTGDKPAITELLKALGAANARPEDHTPSLLIGNDARGTWRRVYGLARPGQLVQLINDAADGKVTQITQEASNL
jgi:hypothetical protein